MNEMEREREREREREKARRAESKDGDEQMHINIDSRASAALTLLCFLFVTSENNHLPRVFTPPFIERMHPDTQKKGIRKKNDKRNKRPHDCRAIQPHRTALARSSSVRIVSVAITTGQDHGHFLPLPLL